jgi:hypothetical protein
MNLKSAPFPVTAEDLLEALDRRFPERHPRLTDSDREVWFNAGKRDLINFVRLWKAESERKFALDVYPQDPQGRHRRRRPA